MLNVAFYLLLCRVSWRSEYGPGVINCMTDSKMLAEDKRASLFIRLRRVSDGGKRLKVLHLLNVGRVFRRGLQKRNAQLVSVLLKNKACCSIKQDSQSADVCS
jgi:hypothetical protein